MIKVFAPPSENLITMEHRFGDETLHLLIPESRQGRYVIEWYYENDAEMAELYFIVCHLRDKNPLVRIQLFMPYIPNARMDRIKTPGEVHTLKHFAKFINDLHFDIVEVLDPHSEVALGLLNGLRGYAWRQKLLGDVLSEVVKNFQVPIAICFPDKSAKERYEMLFPDHHLIFVDKKRDWVTHEITGLKVFDLPKTPLPILLVDDIISYGGTMNKVINVLADAGFNEVYAYATHVEDKIVKGDLFKNLNLKGVYTTNSLGHWRTHVIDYDDFITVIDLDTLREER